MRVSRPLTAALALAAAVSLAAPAQALAATAGATPATGRVPCADPVVDAPLGGEAAVRELGDDLAEAADNVDRSPAQYRRLLRSDDTLRVDQCAQTFVVEPAQTTAALQAAQAAGPGPVPMVAQAGLDPSGDAFGLASRAGAHRTIFLDFDGAQIAGTAWNAKIPARFAPGFTLDGDVTTFTTAELDTIRSVWLRVAEDFAPWDVNVTTADPGTNAINRENEADGDYGTRVLVTSDAELRKALCKSLCGGISYIGLFDEYINHDAYQPALVFPAGSGTSAKGIAEAAAHEAGHTLGLSHDGLGDGTGVGAGNDPYFAGADGGAWAPIMGVGYYQPVTQWSRGEYAGANNSEPDLEVIASNGLSTPRDDHRDDASTTDQMVYGGSPVTGEITTSGDKDAFRFTIPGDSTSATLSVTPLTQGADLDVSLTIYDVTAPTHQLMPVDRPAVRLSDDRADGLAASLSGPLPRGDYVAVVAGQGSGDPAVDGYSDYASLGRYTMTLTGQGGSLTVSAEPAPTATVDSPYAFQLAATGGADKYSWTFAGTLPDGLATTAGGLISGTPRVAGDVTLHATVTSGALTANRDVVLHVVAAPAHIVEQPPAPPAPATPTTEPTQTTPTSPPAPTPTTTPTIPPPVNPGPSRFAGTLRAAVAALPVRAEAGAGYAAARFPLVDADRDCRSTRTEVLQADSRRAVTWTSRTKCAVRAGSWLSLLDRRAVTRAGQVTAVWTVPLAEAWQSGARGWPTARRRAYANDLGDTRTLLAVTTRSARARADREPAAWLPPVASRCTYVADWVAAKLRWGLTADAREKSALARVATGCASTRMVVTRT